MNSHFNCLKCNHSDSCLTKSMTHAERLEFSDHGKDILFMSKDDVLFKESSSKRSIYRVVQGTVKLSKRGENYLKECVGFIQTGSFIGLENFCDKTNSLTAISTEDSVICRVSIEKLHNYCSNNPTIRRSLYDLMSNEVKESKIKVRSHATKLHKGKSHLIVSAVLSMYENSKPNKSFRMPIKNCELAEMFGVSIEKVSRVFKSLRTENILLKNGRNLTVLDEIGLQLAANGSIKLNKKTAKGI